MKDNVRYTYTEGKTRKKVVELHEAATDLREMKSGVVLLWKAPKAYDSHRDKLLRRVDAETEHSWVAKKRSLGCLPFESFILGNVLCLRFSLIDVYG
ncbi:hypothetical protein Tco_0771747 [Tanacetum coccineum]|uniref:Uncharacterized protein n=1 Tax=Tanacetum coccineum TaxID=301880 RepID=A0ABQ4ZHW1_9ASTR